MAPGRCKHAQVCEDPAYSLRFGRPNPHRIELLYSAGDPASRAPARDCRDYCTPVWTRLAVSARRFPAHPASAVGISKWTPAIHAVAGQGGPTPWVVRKRRPAFPDGSVAEHRRLPRHDGGIRPRSIPSETAGGQRAESPGLSRGAILSVNVTGPSLVSVTCMWAPKRPVSTTGCIARARDTA